MKLQSLVSNLDSKINQKNTLLVNSQQQLQQFHQMLLQKYNPIFERMEGIMYQKKFEYLDYLTRQLESNNAKIKLEKETLLKMEKNFNEIKPRFITTLRQQMENIEKQIQR